MRFHPFFHAFAHGDGHRGREFPGPHGLFRRHEHFGGRKRMFEQGDLRFVVLKLISEKPSHGYEIIKAIEERLGGAYAPSPGIIYPTLTLLEEMGAIRVQETEGPRKLYAITPEGEDILRRNEAAVQAIFGRMAEVGARHGGGPAPDVIRGMENLKTALRLRISRGPLSGEQSAEIANILDSAAKAVEAV
ncbi:PadR family transcriptional regulator [Methylocapsa acidiphila]|uniref:PadR family transcriptional regulator n=1 Tax=Methylocapsa acidiphila TaxID=133552 RepID=UPI00040F7C18|nr:PadR family transcriptional regulator [Methylocapsa acidiphila]